MACENCPLHAYSEKNPDSIIARIWRWHTSWCPGWKKYQASLAQAGPDKQSAQD